jgi:hypothetical protein
MVHAAGSANPALHEALQCAIDSGLNSIRNDGVPLSLILNDNQSYEVDEVDETDAVDVVDIIILHNYLSWIWIKR